MNLNEAEKRMIYQVEGTSQGAALNEIYMTWRYAPDKAMKDTAEGLLRKLRPLSDKECMDVIRDVQKNYRLPGKARTIGEMLAEARQQSGAQKLAGHDIMALERFDPDTRHTEPGQTGTVTTNGSRLNVRTGAGLDHTAFTQLPNGTTVEVVGEDGDWLKIVLPERIGYVHSDYMTVSDAETGADGGGLSFSIDPGELESLLGMFGGALPDDVGAALSPDGNLSLIDDIGSPTASGKQFITVESKNGNVFYLIIDRDDEGGETVHFLNQVDEADLMALTKDGGAEKKPIVCSCTEKCQSGAVNTACEVCMTNMSECVGKEPEPVTPDEPEEPVEEKKGGAGAVLAVVLLLAAGGGAASYFLVLKPKQGRKVPSDLDDFDLEDEEEYLTEDEETEDIE